MDNRAVLNIDFEELPEDHKAIITKAAEEYREKCLMSYGRMHDKIIQKHSLPMVLLHGQRDPDDEAETKASADMVHKSVHDALRNHYETFLNTFHNIMKEVFHGAPINQRGPADYNILHPSTQGTNQVGTSQQGGQI